jgi:hypothetical protein
MSQGGIHVSLARSCELIYKTRRWGHAIVRDGPCATRAITTLSQLTTAASVKHWAPTVDALKNFSAAMVREMISCPTSLLHHLLGCVSWFMAITFKERDRQSSFFEATERSLLQGLASRTGVLFSEWRRLFRHSVVSCRTDNDIRLHCTLLSTRGLTADSLAFLQAEGLTERGGSSAICIDMFVPGKLGSAICQPSVNQLRHHPLLTFAKSTGTQASRGLVQGDFLSFDDQDIQEFDQSCGTDGNCCGLVDIWSGDKSVIAYKDIRGGSTILISDDRAVAYRRVCEVITKGVAPTLSDQNALKKGLQDILIAKNTFLCALHQIVVKIGLRCSASQAACLFEAWMAAGPEDLYDANMNFCVAYVAAYTHVRLEGSPFAYLSGFVNEMRWFV